MAIYKPELPMETIERLNGELEIKQKYLTDAYDAIDRLQDELRDKMAIGALTVAYAMAQQDTLQTPEVVASYAYLIADSMMELRGFGPEGSE